MISRHRLTLAAMLSGVILASAARSQMTQPSSRGSWDAVMRGLQSEVFAEREAAQRILNTTSWRDEENLRILEESATDPEVKSRLQTRLDALALDQLLHPPSITLEVNDAGINELAAAMTAATGTQWTAWDRGPAGGPWTLKAQERPLWEIFSALEKQSMVHVQNSGGKISLAPGPMVPGGLGPIDGGWTDVVAGDFLIYVGIGRGLGPVGLHAAGAPVMPTVKLEYGIRGDPRIRLVRSAIPDILSVVDENGNILHAAQPRPAPIWIPPSGTMPEVNTAMGFDDVPGMGKKLTITGRMVVRTATSVEHIEIANLTNQDSAPFLAGGRAWRMSAVEPMGAGQDSWVINMTVRTVEGVSQMFVPVSAKVLDAAGKLVWDGVVDGQTSVRVQPGAVKRPLKAVILAAKDAKDIIVPFEIKDVPVPPAR